MTDFDDLPVPDGPDPIDSPDPEVLRLEILRLRESLLADNGRVEVLRDRIAELERREDELVTAHRALEAELAIPPLKRVIRALRHRLPGTS